MYTANFEAMWYKVYHEKKKELQIEYWYIPTDQQKHSASPQIHEK